MEPYWSYEDIGVFFFVLVFMAAAVRLSVRMHFLRPSELVTPGLALQSFVIIFPERLAVPDSQVASSPASRCSFGMGGPDCLLHHSRIGCRHSICSLHCVPCAPPPSSYADYSGS